jgi:site-specific DNA-methyltransferase (adenine-specific)
LTRGHQPTGSLGRVKGRIVYAFIPDLPSDQVWTDAKLYKRYGLTKAEIAFIESQVAEHDTELFDGAATDEVDDD